MKRNKFQDLLDNYLRGRATPEEEKLLGDVYERLREANIQLTTAEMDALDITGEKLLARIKLGEKVKTRTNSFTWLTAAASILLVCGMSLLTYQHFFNKPGRIMMITKTTSPGEVIKILLPDSSAVWLNGSSSIRYPEKFGNELREVQLHGEAFFDIVHFTKQPFVVHASGLSTQVLGTSFNVKGRRNDLKTEVAVVSGKVAVYRDLNSGSSEGEKPMFVLPGESVVFNKATNILSKRRPDTAELTAWKNDKLVYKNASLGQVAADLERRYNIKIVLSPAIKDCPVYGTFENKTAEEIMRLIAYSINGGLSRPDNSYHLTGKSCK